MKEVYKSILFIIVLSLSASLLTLLQGLIYTVAITLVGWFYGLFIQTVIERWHMRNDKN